MTEKIYTTEDLANILKIRRLYVNQMVSAKKIKAAGRLPGGELYFTEEEVKRFLQERYGSK